MAQPLASALGGTAAIDYLPHQPSVSLENRLSFPAKIGEGIKNWYHSQINNAAQIYVQAHETALLRGVYADLAGQYDHDTIDAYLADHAIDSLEIGSLIRNSIQSHSDEIRTKLIQTAGIFRTISYNNLVKYKELGLEISPDDIAAHTNYEKITEFIKNIVMSPISQRVATYTLAGATAGVFGLAVTGALDSGMTLVGHYKHKIKDEKIKLIIENTMQATQLGMSLLINPYYAAASLGSIILNYAGDRAIMSNKDLGYKLKAAAATINLGIIATALPNAFSNTINFNQYASTKLLMTAAPIAGAAVVGGASYLYFHNEDKIKSFFKTFSSEKAGAGSLVNTAGLIKENGHSPVYYSLLLVIPALAILLAACGPSTLPPTINSTATDRPTATSTLTPTPTKTEVPSSTPRPSDTPTPAATLGVLNSGFDLYCLPQPGAGGPGTSAFQRPIFTEIGSGINTLNIPTLTLPSGGFQNCVANYTFNQSPPNEPYQLLFYYLEDIIGDSAPAITLANTGNKEIFATKGNTVSTTITHSQLISTSASSAANYFMALITPGNDKIFGTEDDHIWRLDNLRIVNPFYKPSGNPGGGGGNQGPGTVPTDETDPTPPVGTPEG